MPALFFLLKLKSRREVVSLLRLPRNGRGSCDDLLCRGYDCGVDVDMSVWTYYNDAVLSFFMGTSRHRDKKLVGFFLINPLFFAGQLDVVRVNKHFNLGVTSFNADYPPVMSHSFTVHRHRGTDRYENQHLIPCDFHNVPF